MKIVFNSREKSAACTVFYKEAFSYCKDITIYDSDRFEEYDVALFMTYKSDLEDMKRTKNRHPGIKTAIIDPRGSWIEPYLPYADFLIVDSLEMKDFWAYSHKPIFQYVEYPDIGVLTRKHKKKEKIILGYHGNKVHLECMYERITPALEQIAVKYDVELWAMYNVNVLGEWNSNLPKNIKVRHIQWSKDNYHEILGEVDIGINPCFMPMVSVGNCQKFSLLRKKRDRKLNESKDDYILRFKMPSNPGRIIVWGLLGVPVVTDFIPSAIQCVQDGVCGFLSCSTGGWYCAIEKLILDHKLRQKMSDRLQEKVTKQYPFVAQNTDLYNFLIQEIVR